MPRERYQNPKLQQNANGSWFIRPWVDVLTADGVGRRKRQIVLGAESIGKREAILRKRRAMEVINRASYVIQSQIPFGALLDEYEKRHSARQAAPTQKKYASLISCHIRPAFGSLPVGTDPSKAKPGLYPNLQLFEVTTKRVQEWLDAKAVPGPDFKSWSTRSDLRQLMSGIFERAIAWRYWQEGNPIEHVTAGRKRLAREKVKLSDDQTRKLLAALPGQVRTMASVALFTTLRISEVLALQEKHIDFENGDLRVEQRFYRGELNIVKTQRSDRSVPLGYLVDDLKRLCLGDPERFIFQVETRCGRPGPNQRTFICRDDRSLQRYFLRPAAKEIGCYRLGFGWHSLRREAVTAFNASLGVTQAMRLAGHATADMSAEYTLRDREAQDKAVRERQMKLMGEPEGKIA